MRHGVFSVTKSMGAAVACNFAGIVAVIFTLWFA
jgi:hypothetical protein